jgi:hypothetical protein
MIHLKTVNRGHNVIPRNQFGVSRASKCCPKSAVLSQLVWAILCFSRRERTGIKLYLQRLGGIEAKLSIWLQPRNARPADKILLVIGDYTIYWDESYSHPPEPRAYTVAGYLSTAVHWKKFQKEWRRVLESEGIRFFHMVDFQACRPPYDSWSKEKRVKFLRSLHDIVHKRTILSFVTTADLDDFDKLTPEQQCELVNPHVFSAKNCMKAVGFWAAESIINHQIIDYVFEQSPQDKKLRKLFTEGLTEEDRWFFRMASLTVADKRIMSPLQAADMLAYEANKEIVRNLNPINPRPVRLSAKNLANNPEKDKWFYCEYYSFLGALKADKLRVKDYAQRHVTSTD